MMLYGIRDFRSIYGIGNFRDFTGFGALGVFMELEL
jgi:selenophosphate synthase